jgi:hypothetical protein
VTHPDDVIAVQGAEYCAIKVSKWPCNTSSENSSKSKTNTRTGKPVLKLVKIPNFRNIGLLLIK